MSQQLITTFYDAFQRGDADAMTACYHDEVVFEDPAFGLLEGARAKAMWHMLLGSASGGVHVEYSDVCTYENTGSVKWTARYTFGPKQRPVVNHVIASFGFAGGKIARHTDRFDLWAWSRQALGLPGLLLGWSPIIKKQVQATTAARLEKYLAR